MNVITKFQKRHGGMRTIEFCPVSFKHHGQSCHAIMQDLSNGGAQLVAFNSHEYPSLTLGDQLAMNVRTPYGESAVKGNVRWIGEKNGHFNWGVEFTSLATDAKDPIRCMMDSPW